jgi:hypothetical protein
MYYAVGEYTLEKHLQTAAIKDIEQLRRRLKHSVDTIKRNKRKADPYA